MREKREKEGRFHQQNKREREKEIKKDSFCSICERG
jgi:hypothetical protein